MTPEEFAEKMREIAGDTDDYHYDQEYAHIEMDSLMCDLLNSLGYGDGVTVFRNAPKWYS